MPTSILCLRAQRSMARVAQRNRSFSRGPVIAEEGPEEVRHSEGDVLPVAVGEDVLLLSNPLFGGFHSA